MRLLLVRHGQTNLNAERCFQGWADEPLNETGREQMRAIRTQTPDRIYCSDLVRSVESARCIAASFESRPRVTEDERLREFFFGAWETRRVSDVAKEEPSAVERWFVDPFAHPPKGGETLFALAARLHNFLLDLKTLGGCVMIVGHQLSNAVMTSILDRRHPSIWERRQSAGSVVEADLACPS